MGAIAERPIAAKADKARLVIDNLSSPVIAKVTHRSRERLTVEQALPFLQLKNGVRDEAGRRARIQAVGVKVEDGTPNLVLDLVYETGVSVSGGALGVDDTLPAFRIAPKRPLRLDQTVPFGFPRQALLKKSFGEDDTIAFGGDCEETPFLLLTDIKEPKRITIAPERHRTRGHEATMLLGADARSELISDELVPIDLAAFECFESEADVSPERKSFVARARALAAAFWSSFSG